MWADLRREALIVVFDLRSVSALLSLPLEGGGSLLCRPFSGNHLHS